MKQLKDGQVRPKLDEEWKNALAAEFDASYFAELKSFLEEEKRKHTIFPSGGRIFAALDLTPPSRVKVVILGQDPYHGAGQAHGLAFSVPQGVPFPPSLRNIVKEIERDLGINIDRRNGNLESWAKQGVLLLNATLTVREASAGSHQKKGWERFTDAIIRHLSQDREGIVFMLWGRYAQDKANLIDASKHHILRAPHPSPLSAHQGFIGCSHFSKCNELLKEAGRDPINWQIS